MSVFTGLGCDTSAVINILAHRDATQRAYIQQEYKTMYSEELSKRLASELSGNLEVLITSNLVKKWTRKACGKDGSTNNITEKKCIFFMQKV